MAIVSPLPIVLIIAVFAIDLLTPILIWKGFLPSIVRWGSDAAVVALLGILMLRMLAFNQFPIGFWLISGLTILSAAQATMQGQSFDATLWGWWRTFALPLLAVFAYLHPHWPDKFPSYLRRICVALMVLEVAVQILQYLTGEPVGDHLAGTLGANGVSLLLVFLSFTLSLTLGYAATTGKWNTFLFVFALGILSSALAENKIFPVIALMLAFFAAGFYLWLGGKFVKLVPYGVLLLVGLTAFILAYNFFVPIADRRPLQQMLFDEETREQYNQNISGDTVAGGYDMGRDFAMQYAWQFIRSHPDPMVFLFGLGLGAKSESVSIGIVGIAFEQDGLGLTPGTGIMVLMEEMGLVGMIVFLLFMLTLTVQLAKDIWAHRESVATELRIGILIFTWLWPIWLWYKPVLSYRETMIVYWVAIGYVLYQRRHDVIARDANEAVEN